MFFHSRSSLNLLCILYFERHKIEMSRIAAQIASYSLLALYFNQANDIFIFLDASKVMKMFNQLIDF